jgi:hypothetical protein
MDNRKPKRQELTPPPDNEGDSTMHSSADEDEMFPDEALPNNPATPMNASIQNLAAAPELSPPNSQGGPANLPREPSTLSSAVNANGKRPLSLAQTASTMPQGTHTDSDTGYSWSRQEEQPGWEWKNTRAREDESRALDAMVDLGSQIKSMCHLGGARSIFACKTDDWVARYGDPLEGSALGKAKR